MTKLLGRIHEVGTPFVAEDGFLQGNVDSFPTFLDRFHKVFGWNALEKDSLALLFLKDGQPYTFKTALETRTLTQWENLLRAQSLATMIEERRVVTWFHPIWDTRTQTLFGWECLLRGVENDGSLVSPGAMFAQAQGAGMTFPLDRLARLNALQTAKDKGVKQTLFINFIPTAIYDPVFCLRTTVELAQSLGFANERIVFEVVETERVNDWRHLKGIETREELAFVVHEGADLAQGFLWGPPREEPNESLSWHGVDEYLRK